MKKTTKLCYKDITLFIHLGVKTSVDWERQTETNGDKRRQRQLYWPITSSSLDYSPLYYLQSPTYLFYLSAEGYSTGGLLWAAVPEGSPATHRRTLWLPESLLTARLRLPVSQVDIFMYHFITPTHFRSTTPLLPLIFTGASSLENLWLTAWSRVNILHMKLKISMRKPNFPPGMQESSFGLAGPDCP